MMGAAFNWKLQFCVGLVRAGLAESVTCNPIVTVPAVVPDGGVPDTRPDDWFMLNHDGAAGCDANAHRNGCIPVLGWIPGRPVYGCPTVALADPIVPQEMIGAGGTAGLIWMVHCLGCCCAGVDLSVTPTLTTKFPELWGVPVTRPVAGSIEKTDPVTLVNENV